MYSGSDVAQTLPPVDTTSWAKRLAESRRRAVEARSAPVWTGDAVWIPTALVILWTLFDNAAEEANRALERAGLPDRITVSHTAGESHFSMTESGGEQRGIAVFASLQNVQSHASGGVLITTTATRAAIHLVAVCENGMPRWIVAATREEFTARDVDDLFLVTFCDDAIATSRLCALFSLDGSM